MLGPGGEPILTTDESAPVLEALEALSELVAAGKVVHVACSNFSGEQIDEAERVGMHIDTALLAEKLEIPVVGAAIGRKRGVRSRSIQRTASSKAAGCLKKEGLVSGGRIPSPMRKETSRSISRLPMTMGRRPCPSTTHSFCFSYVHSVLLR